MKIERKTYRDGNLYPEAFNYLKSLPENIDYLLERCDNLLIKTSPMLDISHGLKELSRVAEVPSPNCQFQEIGLFLDLS